jgi:hypothetical protein
MSIFSCVIDEVQDVISQVVQQSNMVDEVAGGIRNGMQPIMGGAWVGEGANAFIDEVNTRLIPQIMQLVASIAGFGGSITSALDIISQADNEVGGIVGPLGDVFDSIF